MPYWHMDIGCAIMVLLLLAGVNAGLAAGFAGVYDLYALRVLLGIPTEVLPVGVIPIGHPALDTPSPSLKRGRTSDAEFIARRALVEREYFSATCARRAQARDR